MRLPEGEAEGLTNFVWLHKEGPDHSEELRLSMLSVERFFSGKSRFTVIGDRPHWYDGHHIAEHRRPLRDRPQRMPFRDTQAKIITACESDEIEDEFVWMMDDQIFLKPITIEDLRTPRFDPWHRPNRANEWNKILFETFQILRGKGKPVKQYATHLPHIFEKSQMLQCFYDFGCPGRLLIFEVLYGNIFRADPIPYTGFLCRVKTKQEMLRVKPEASVLNYYWEVWCEETRSKILSLLDRQIPQPA